MMRLDDPIPPRPEDEYDPDESVFQAFTHALNELHDAEGDDEREAP